MSEQGTRVEANIERDRVSLERRMVWEQTGVRALRFVFALWLLYRGLSPAFDGGLAWSGLVPTTVGVLILLDLAWELGRTGEDPPIELSEGQRLALEQTLRQDGRVAAVKQFRMWTSATFQEAKRAVDAAFPS